MQNEPRFLFIGGTLAIDFVHTGGLDWRAHFERWHSPADLEDWAQASPDLGFRPSATEADRNAAWALREAIWAYGRAVVEQRALPQAAAELIADIATTPDLVPSFEQGRRVWKDGSPFAHVLSSVARDAITLFGTDAVSRFHECAGPNCQLMFVDHSRSGKRQWCTMERCGNRMKVKRHRAKAKGGTNAD